MQQLPIVGQSCRRVDVLAKLTGEAKYTADLGLPGMLWGRILRSPHPHALVREVDARRAQELSGVAVVVTAQDTPMIKYGHYLHDEMLLASEKVRYVGDEIAVVAAVSQDIAEKSLRLIDVKYEKLPAVFGPAEALQPDAPQVHEAGNIAQSYVFERGDIAGGFQTADCILEETFHVPYASQACLEPTACLASLDRDGRITVWAPSAAPFELRSQIVAVLDISPAKVRVIQPFVGGHFGGRARIKTAIIAALLAQKTRKPVKIILSREEEFISCRPRIAAVIKLRMGFAKDGEILAKETSIIADNGAYTDIAPRPVETMARRIDSLYRIKNIHTSVRLVYTNKVPTGAYRGFGNPQMTFALESMLDMAAERLGIDPVTIRLRNATRSGDITAHGWKISSCGLTECIERVAGELAKGSRKEAQIKNGLGMGCMIHVSGRHVVPGFSGAKAWVRLQETGKVIVYSGEAEVGQGSRTVFAQIAAEELGIPLKTVEIAPLDTDLCPYAMGSFSDRVTILGGNAVRAAAAQARQQLIGLAAKYFAVEESRVAYNFGILTILDAGRSIDMFELLQLYKKEKGEFLLLGIGEYVPPTEFPDPRTKYGNIAPAYTFAAQVAELGIDFQTGQVRVEGFHCAHDVGRAINPKSAQGQVEGALAQGLGYALSEECLWEDGYQMNASLLEYKVPTILDVPQPCIELIESNEVNGPFGAKGVGEPGLVPVAPAVGNAIYQATGARITTLPITPDKILQALQKSGGAEHEIA